MTTPTTPASPPEGEPVLEQVSRPRSRYSMGTMPNMLRSVLVMALFVAALFAIVPRISEVERPAVDAVSKASFTAKQTGWPIELPVGLSGWVPTVATYAEGTDKVPTFTTVWQTPGGADVALKQAVGASDTWLARSVNDGAPFGAVQVGSRTFERYAADSGRQLSYVVRGAGSTGLTIAASGNASEDELRTFVAALKPVRLVPLGSR